MNVLLLYNATQTYTNTVFEHLNSFAKYSKKAFFFCHHDQNQQFNIDLSKFDVVVIHYSIRLPYDQISNSAADALSKYHGLKVLFIQDEYDYTYKTWNWIKRLGINLVFTVVPTKNIHRIYPQEDFPSVRFINNLTGYVPEDLPIMDKILPPSKRDIIVGYRGRPLHIKYGQLGRDKIRIGKMVKEYCMLHNIKHDIAWTEEARIYSDKWYEFIASCRSMLGTESGSNVFDWDGSLSARIEEFVKNNSGVNEDDIYHMIIKPLEQPGLMNQISPRCFETIALRTVLILFEGTYSGILEPWKHYIPLKKDGSNLDEVFTLLHDENYIDKMVETAYEEIIASDKYSYRTFVEMVDKEIEISLNSLMNKPSSIKYKEISSIIPPSPITTVPIRSLPPLQLDMRNNLTSMLYIVWNKIPARIRFYLKPVIKKILRRQ